MINLCLNILIQIFDKMNYKINLNLIIFCKQYIVIPTVFRKMAFSVIQICVYIFKLIIIKVEYISFKIN